MFEPVNFPWQGTANLLSKKIIALKKCNVNKKIAKSVFWDSAILLHQQGRKSKLFPSFCDPKSFAR